MTRKALSLLAASLLALSGTTEADPTNQKSCATLRFSSSEEPKGITLELRKILESLSSSASIDPDKATELLGSPDRELRTWNYYRASWSLADDGLSSSHGPATAERDARITRIAIVEYVWERSRPSACKVYTKVNFSSADSAPPDPYVAEGWPGDCIADCDYILARMLGDK